MRRKLIKKKKHKQMRPETKIEVVFMRWHGQDSAYVGLGTPLQVYQTAMKSPDATLEQFEADHKAHEFSFEKAHLGIGDAMPVGHLC